MRTLIIASTVILLIAVVYILADADAQAHYYPGCKSVPCKKHVIRPYRSSFLGPVGACESGTGSWNLRVGLRAINPTGSYRGRYQFGWDDWDSAGGTGDPAKASWIEQAYRAVLWLHFNGRQSWPNC